MPIHGGVCSKSEVCLGRPFCVSVCGSGEKLRSVQGTFGGQLCLCIGVTLPTSSAHPFRVRVSYFFLTQEIRGGCQAKKSATPSESEKQKHATPECGPRPIQKPSPRSGPTGPEARTGPSSGFGSRWDASLEATSDITHGLGLKNCGPFRGVLGSQVCELFIRVQHTVPSRGRRALTWPLCFSQIQV